MNIVLQRGAQCVLLQQRCDDVDGLGAATVEALSKLPQEEAISADAEAEAAERTKLVGLALSYLKADCYGEFDVHASLIAETSSMYVARGRDDVVALKRTILDPNGVNYDVDDNLVNDEGKYQFRVRFADFLNTMG